MPTSQEVAGHFLFGIPLTQRIQLISIFDKKWRTLKFFAITISIISFLFYVTSLTHLAVFCHSF